MKGGKPSRDTSGCGRPPRAPGRSVVPGGMAAGAGAELPGAPGAAGAAAGPARALALCGSQRACRLVWPSGSTFQLLNIEKSASLARRRHINAGSRGWGGGRAVSQFV